MSDTISRAAAIDIVKKNTFRLTFAEEQNCEGRVAWSADAVYSDVIEGALLELPSAQPNLQPTCNQLATDVISRQDAIDAVAKALKGTFVEYEDIAEKIINKVPSAQPKPVRINLNEPIKVKLTEWGKEIYYHQYDKANQIAGREICKPKFPKEDENGYTEFQLWCFIELYGIHMGMTMPNVIDPLEIVYERRTE